MTRDLVSIDSEIYPSVIIFTPVSQFLVNLSFLGACSAKYLNSVLNVEALVGAFKQEKALVGAFSVIVKSSQTFAGCSTAWPGQNLSCKQLVCLTVNTLPG